jgi:hypothetical protein
VRNTFEAELGVRHQSLPEKHFDQRIFRMSLDSFNLSNCIVPHGDSKVLF